VTLKILTITFIYNSVKDTYYTSSTNDGPYFKALGKSHSSGILKLAHDFPVYGLMCIQIAETALVSYGVYYTDSLNWGNPKVILMVNAEIAQNVQPMLIGICEAIRPSGICSIEQALSCIFRSNVFQLEDMAFC
jgi:hypothetical protein